MLCHNIHVIQYRCMGIHYLVEIQALHVHMWSTHVHHRQLSSISHMTAQCNNVYEARQDGGIRLCTSVLKAIDKAAEV